MRLTSFGHATVLIETGTERILVDPWLTPRLDRFWEHFPAQPPRLLELLEDGIDYVVFSHHHYDHHHWPSLVRLGEALEVDFDESPLRAADCVTVWPREEGLPLLSYSGLGHQAIAWTQRRLGYSRTNGVRPGDVVQLGRTVLRTQVSRVPFPEMSLLFETPDGTVLLAGDSVLHPDTERLFDGPQAPPVDVALIPAHSLAPPGVLTQRRQVTPGGDLTARAAANFDRWVDAVGAKLTIPSSFGWRVHGDAAWANKSIFPFTPWQALQHLRSTGREGALWGPGGTLDLAGGDLRLDPGDYDFQAVSAEVTLDPGAGVPAFDPERDQVGRQREPTGRLVQRLMDELVGTDFWYREIEGGADQSITVYEQDGKARGFVLDFAGERVRALPSEAEAGAGHTSIAGATLQAMFDSELLMGSSYGLWTSNNAMLSAVFHNPLFYVRHVDRALAGHRR
jgi:L-ascorbate metabolism protein UlaG (beta-lactamase superfamily)